MKKINRRINETLALVAELQLGFQKMALTSIAKRCQASENVHLREFGDGIQIGMIEGEMIGRATPAFYRKYADRLIPSLWCARDLKEAFRPAVEQQLSVGEYIESAVNY